MTYYARFSAIKDGYGLMGVVDKEFEANTIEGLKEEIQAFYDDNETKTISYLLDELENENGEEIAL